MKTYLNCDPANLKGNQHQVLRLISNFLMFSVVAVTCRVELKSVFVLLILDWLFHYCQKKFDWFHCQSFSRRLTGFIVRACVRRTAIFMFSFRALPLPLLFLFHIFIARVCVLKAAIGLLLFRISVPVLMMRISIRHCYMVSTYSQ